MAQLQALAFSKAANMGIGPDLMHLVAEQSQVLRVQAHSLYHGRWALGACMRGLPWAALTSPPPPWALSRFAQEGAAQPHIPDLAGSDHGCPTGLGQWMKRARLMMRSCVMGSTRFLKLA